MVMFVFIFWFVFSTFKFSAETMDVAIINKVRHRIYFNMMII